MPNIWENMLHRRTAHYPKETKRRVRRGFLCRTWASENLHRWRMWGSLAPYKIMVNHRGYHFGKEINAYGNKSETGIIDIRTPYGFGAHIVDKRIFVDKSLFGKRYSNGNVWYAPSVKTNIDGIESLGISRRRTLTHQEYQNERCGISRIGKFKEPKEEWGDHGESEQKEQTIANQSQPHIRTRMDNDKLFIYGDTASKSDALKKG